MKTTVFIVIRPGGEVSHLLHESGKHTAELEKDLASGCTYIAAEVDTEKRTIVQLKPE